MENLEEEVKILKRMVEKRDNVIIRQEEKLRMADFTTKPKGLEAERRKFWAKVFIESFRTNEVMGTGSYAGTADMALEAFDSRFYAKHT